MAHKQALRRASRLLLLQAYYPGCSLEDGLPRQLQHQGQRWAHARQVLLKEWGLPSAVACSGERRAACTFSAMLLSAMRAESCDAVNEAHRGTQAERRPATAQCRPQDAPAAAQCQVLGTHVHHATRLARLTSQMGAPATCRPVPGSSPSASWAVPGQRP